MVRNYTTGLEQSQWTAHCLEPWLASDLQQLEVQVFFFASQGHRAIAHDRRGLGRSSQRWEGNVMDTYADDLKQLLEKLDLKNAILVGHSAGGGEVTRFLGKHGSERVVKATHIVAVTPLLRKTEGNPEGLATEYYDGFRAAFVNDRA